MTRSLRWAIALGVWWVAGVVVSWAAEKPADLLLQDGEHHVTVAQYQRMLLALPEALRTRHQGDAPLRGDLLRLLDQRQRMAAEAERLGVAEQPEVQARLAEARSQILSDALLERHRYSLQLPDFTALAREHYLAHQELYRVPEQLDLAQIWLKVDCACERAERRALAETILTRLRAGESFAELARQYSDNRQDAVNRGGRLPLPFSRGSQPEPSAFETAAFALTPEQPLSDIVETPQGFYIVQLLERREATVRDFEAVKAGIIEQLGQNYVAAQMTDYQAQFKTSPTAVINETLLQQQTLPQ